VEWALSAAESAAVTVGVVDWSPLGPPHRRLGAISIGMDAMRQSSAGLRWYPLIHVERDSGSGTYRGRATQCGAVRMAWQWRPAPEAAEQRWQAVARCGGGRGVLSGDRFD
jgi:hypothetical protein